MKLLGLPRGGALVQRACDGQAGSDDTRRMQDGAAGVESVTRHLRVTIEEE